MPVDASAQTTLTDARPAGARRWWRWALAVAVVSSVLVAGVVADGWAAWDRLERLEVQPRAEGTGTTYLLVGVDHRTDDPTARTAPGARADVIVVVHKPTEGDVRAVSVPRDLLVTLPGGERNRLTTAWDRGPQVLVDVLCSALGVGVEHVVALDMEGFAEVVDAVGGIDVEVPRAVRDGWTGIDLPAGPVHLDGPTALAYVRTRRALVYQDGAWATEAKPEEGRRIRAASALVALARELAGLRWQPVGLHHAVWALTDALQVDADLTPADAADLAGALRNVANDGDALVHLPVAVAGAAVPVAGLGPGAEQALASVGAGAGTCKVPLDPAAPSQVD